MLSVDRLLVLCDPRNTVAKPSAVDIKPRIVGTIARSRDELFAFDYHDDWIKSGFPLNPLTLPLEKRVFIPRRNPLDGMFGIFKDSLPDGWGCLLVDRSLSAHGEDPFAIDDLVRLAIVGSSGMGALSYEPDYSTQLFSAVASDAHKEDLDALAVIPHIKPVGKGKIKSFVFQ